MSKKSKIRDAVGKSQIENWTRHPFAAHVLDDEIDRVCWVYENDVNLRLERSKVLEDDFEREWTEDLPGSSRSYEYYLFYANSPVESYTIVSVDDHNAALPTPEVDGEDRHITPYQAVLGRVITGNYQDFEMYLDWTGIEVQ